MVVSAAHLALSASWLPQIVSWFIAYDRDDEMHGSMETELEEYIRQIQALYAAARDGIRTSKVRPLYNALLPKLKKTQRRSTMLLSPMMHGTISQGAESSASLPNMLASEKLVSSLSKGFMSRMLKLLVTVSVLLTVEDHRQIGPMLWDHYLEVADGNTVLSVCGQLSVEYLALKCR